MSSYYGAIAIVTIFYATVIFICCKLARQTNQIEQRYSPCRIQSQPEVRIREPRSGPYRTSVATQTVSVEQLYAALKKETGVLGRGLQNGGTGELGSQNLNWLAEFFRILKFKPILPKSYSYVNILQKYSCRIDYIQNSRKERKNLKPHKIL